MEDPKTLDLLKELLLHLSPSPPDLPKSLRYALRLLSSRISPPLPADPLQSLSESLKKTLIRRHRPSQALTLADLLSALSSKSGPGSVSNLPSLLLLLKSLAEHPPLSCSGAPLPETLTLTPSKTSRKTLFFAKDGDNLREIALREYAELARADSVPESALVKDVLYVAQGIDGKYVRYNPAADGYDVPASLPASTRLLVRRLCEIGWLYRRIQRYVPVPGVVGQAFAAAVADEMTEFYKLLAVLDAHAAHPLPEPGQPVHVSYLSLRRLTVWLWDPLQKLRLMAVLVDLCGELRGGAMASAAHTLSRHGDPAIKSLMGRLLCRLTGPLFAMVKAWVIHGELRDPHSEFFVISQPIGPASLWRCGYVIDSSMVPSFISPELAANILRTGKSINFLRACCRDNAWTSGLEEQEDEEEQEKKLEAMVMEAAKRTDSHLLEVFNGKFKFRDHCKAIKRYLLLGQGDFVQRLLDLVSGELSQPARGISVFHLSGLLESAVRGSNAQYDDRDIIGRIKVKMMEGEGEINGWDVFSLEYEAREPLDTVFTVDAMGRYLKVFNFLVKLRRAELALVAVWRKGGLGRRWQVLRSEMSHFVTNFQCYVMFEVLEVTWAKFEEEMDGARDLDRLIEAHERFLGAILEKSLLGERSREINKTLFDLLDVILRFRAAADRLVLGFCPSQQPLRGKRKSKQKKGAGTRESIEYIGRSNELENIAKEYSTLLKRFISQLPAQQHVDLKFLLFRLDFTEFYSRLSPAT